MRNLPNVQFWGKTSLWWVITTIGILLIPGGFWLLFSPMIGYLTITNILLWMLILLGFVQLLIAVNMSRIVTGWGWWLAGGFIDIFLGFMLLGNISLSTIILPYFLAFIFLYKGVINIVSAFGITTRNKSWWFYLANGSMFLILATLFFISPFTAAIAIDYLFAIAFIYWGISLVLFSIDLRPEKSSDKEILAKPEKWPNEW